MSKRKKRHVCVLTGTRAEYGLLRSLMRAIQTRPELDLQVAVTGTHLLKAFGQSEMLIRQDGFSIDARIPMYRDGEDIRRELPASLGRVVDGLGQWLIDHESDFIVVLGDRVEALGGALAGLTANVPVVHLHGGEIAPGDMDDRIRFSISALASLHFVGTADAKRRLIRGGEPADRIFIMGALGLDEIFQAKKQFDAQRCRDFRNRLGIGNDNPMMVLVQHPCAFGADQEREFMTQILRSINGFDGLIIGPNNDPGHSGIRQAIKRFLAEKNKTGRWGYVENIPREEYLLAVASADILMGNSSSGIIEANALGTAVVNIGPRQEGRERNGNAIFDCGYKEKDIRAALAKAMEFIRTHTIRPSRKFGQGLAGETVSKVLSKVSVSRSLIVKPRSR
ncbi:MAG: UDP-N-acetylglucosamine 2-epimerase (hydrolyzing) [Phycisphaerae bacterium]|nr:UDP-N-acetylglucosamine 2-epimerase (hydrolyzing) [Phycisphaerae bacterium]